jgi:hypothetical protein
LPRPRVMTASRAIETVALAVVVAAWQPLQPRRLYENQHAFFPNADQLPASV